MEASISSNRVPLGYLLVFCLVFRCLNGSLRYGLVWFFKGGWAVFSALTFRPVLGFRHRVPLQGQTEGEYSQLCTKTQPERSAFPSYIPARLGEGLRRFC